MPRTPDNGIDLDLNVKYTPSTQRQGHVVPVEMTWDDKWAKALPNPLCPLIRIRATAAYDSDAGHVSPTARTEVLYAKSADEKVALLLDARDDDIVLLSWTGQRWTDVFTILDVGPALQALGLRPAKVEPIRSADGREWLANDPSADAWVRARRQRALTVNVHDDDCGCRVCLGEYDQ